MTSARIIQEARLRAGLTQAALAQRLGRDRAQIARWETGGQEPSFENVRALFEALERERVSYVLVGGFARVVHGSGETTHGIDIVPSLREENLRRLARALEGLDSTDADGGPIRHEELPGDAPFSTATRAGRLTVVPMPWGTRGYDDIRIRANRENLGRGIRPQIASLVDLTRMLEASPRDEDHERLQRHRRLMELERRLTRQRSLGIER